MLLSIVIVVKNRTATIVEDVTVMDHRANGLMDIHTVKSVTLIIIGMELEHIILTQNQN